MDAKVNSAVRTPMKHQPLGSRQHRILLYARARSIEGKSFPTPRECAKNFQYKGPASDIKESFRALERRGLIVRMGKGYRLTALGWAVA